MCELNRRSVPRSSEEDRRGHEAMETDRLTQTADGGALGPVPHEGEVEARDGADFLRWILTTFADESPASELEDGYIW
jgi:hypothetical protein